MKDCSLSYCFPSWCVPDYAGIVVTCSQVWDCDVDVLGETQVLGDDGRNNRTIWIAKKNQQTKLEKCLNKKGFGFSGGSTCILSKCPYGTSGVGYTDGDDDDDDKHKSTGNAAAHHGSSRDYSKSYSQSKISSTSKKSSSSKPSSSKSPSSTQSSSASVSSSDKAQSTIGGSSLSESNDDNNDSSSGNNASSGDSSNSGSKDDSSAAHSMSKSSVLMALIGIATLLVQVAL